MGYAYTNNGLSFRAWDDPTSLQDGEVYFASHPTGDQLAVAFPGYPAAKAAYDLAKQARVALTSGLTVQSVSNPSINGTYSIDDMALSRINAITTYVVVNGKFPGSNSSFPITDSAGVMHMFDDVALFQKWATAIADYVANLHIILVTGNQPLPSSVVVIP